MAFTNIKRILSSVPEKGTGFSAYKLLIMAAARSRPRYRKLCDVLLKPFVKDGEVLIKYSCFGRLRRAYIRMSDIDSDYLSVSELVIGSAYNVPPKFAADFVLDGGGNIGLFSLYASAAYPKAKIVICEPVPSNVAQIEKHLRVNGVHAEVKQVCIGGFRRTMTFYCRESITGSTDSTKPYTSQMDVEVLPLAELVSSGDTDRIFIKLDIEGMEIEALESYVSSEARAVWVVGELHDHSQNKHRLEGIFESHGWRLSFSEESDELSIFEACSPAAAADCLD